MLVFRQDIRKLNYGIVHMVDTLDKKGEKGEGEASLTILLYFNFHLFHESCLL